MDANYPPNEPLAEGPLEGGGSARGHGGWGVGGLGGWGGAFAWGGGGLGWLVGWGGGLGGAI